MAIMKKRINEFPTPYTATAAISKGAVETKLSILIMGLGNIVHKQAVKGLLYLAIEAIYFAFMAISGLHCLAMLPSLGTVKQEEIWNEALQIYEYTQGDNSVLILLYGVATILITVLMFFFWREALRSAYKAECLDRVG